jgi:hypothetical protein
MVFSLVKVRGKTTLNTPACERYVLCCRYVVKSACEVLDIGGRDQPVTVLYRVGLGNRKLKYGDWANNAEVGAVPGVRTNN